MALTKTAVWQQWDNIGLEYLELTEVSSKDGVVVESNIIGFEERIPFQMHYRLHCLENYQVFSVMITLSGHRHLNLSRLSTGQWRGNQNEYLPALDGCYDIDITATPFTNTLPIRRLQWQVGQSRSLDMAYIHIPELKIERATQQYTCLEKNEQGSLFEFRQQDFSTILPIDADGFVQNYPNLFLRLS